MARFRSQVAGTLEVPVIDPSQAAVVQAVAAVRLAD
jgi:Asp/Glu/hydantoin racemase